VNFHYDSPAQVNIMLYHLCILTVIAKFTFITTTLLKEYCWLKDFYCMTKHFKVVVSDWERCRYTICWRMGLDLPNKVVVYFCVVMLYAWLVDLWSPKMYHTCFSKVIPIGFNEGWKAYTTKDYCQYLILFYASSLSLPNS